jgi:hypothetical protein
LRCAVFLLCGAAWLLVVPLLAVVASMPVVLLLNSMTLEALLGSIGVRKQEHSNLIVFVAMKRGNLTKKEIRFTSSLLYARVYVMLGPAGQRQGNRCTFNGGSYSALGGICLAKGHVSQT